MERDLVGFRCTWKCTWRTLTAHVIETSAIQKVVSLHYSWAKLSWYGSLWWPCLTAPVQGAQPRNYLRATRRPGLWYCLTELHFTVIFLFLVIFLFNLLKAISTTDCSLLIRQLRMLRSGVSASVSKWSSAHPKGVCPLTSCELHQDSSLRLIWAIVLPWWSIKQTFWCLMVVKQRISGTTRVFESNGRAEVLRNEFP